MKLRIWCAAATLVLFAFAAVADDKPAKKEMSADEKAMMEAWMKAMTPGDNHKHLDAMAGSWDTKLTFWMAPDAPPTTSTGVSENRWILGNRVLEQRFKGTYMDQPFEGIGHTGYDNVKKQYWGTWIDNMGTGIMTSTGTSADGGKTWTFKGTYADPMTGKDTSMEEKITVIDKDHHKFEMWGPAPDGKIYKSMMIEYTRRK